MPGLEQVKECDLGQGGFIIIVNHLYIGGRIPNTSSTLDDLRPLRLLVAVDGSSGSLRALQRTVELVRDVPAYEVVVILVLDEGSVRGKIVNDPDPMVEPRARSVLDEAVVYLRNEGVEATAELLRGPPVALILEFADEFGPTMLLVGSRGMGQGKLDAVGSVAEAVSKRSRWPVLVVRS